MRKPARILGTTLMVIFGFGLIVSLLRAQFDTITIYYALMTLIGLTLLRWGQRAWLTKSDIDFTDEPKR